MSNSDGQSATILEQVLDATIKKLRASKVYDEVSLKKLEVLARNAQLKNKKKTAAALESVQGANHEID